MKSPHPFGPTLNSPSTYVAALAAGVPASVPACLRACVPAPRFDPVLAGARGFVYGKVEVLTCDDLGVEATGVSEHPAEFERRRTRKRVASIARRGAGLYVVDTNCCFDRL